MKVQIDKSVIELANEFNLYFTSLNSVDVNQKIIVDRDEWRSLYASICAALAAQEPAQAVEPDPVAWIDANGDLWDYPSYGRQPTTPLYTHPAPAKPLSDEQIKEILKELNNMDFDNDEEDEWNVALITLVEAAHGIKETS